VGRSDLHVEVQGSEITVTMPGTAYSVVYQRSSGPWLIAKSDYGPDDLGAQLTQAEFLAGALQTANTQARELGWILQQKAAGAAASTLPKRVISQIAKLAPVPMEPERREQFDRWLGDVVRLAWCGHGAPARKDSRQSDVTAHLDGLLSDLISLMPGGEGQAAGGVLAATIAPHTIEDWIHKVERAKINASENADTKLRVKGTPKATRGSPGFDVFLAELIGVAEPIFGFEWTASTDRAHDSPVGSLVAALEALKPHLPRDFIPSHATLLRAINRTRQKLQRK
jgi:hypothetical protein